MRGNDLVNQFTAIDKTVLDARDAYVDYFKHLLRAFDLLLDAYNRHTKDDAIEVKIIQSFIQRFLTTVEALRMKYLYDEENKLRIDPTDSGFPNFLEFRELQADLLVKEERLKGLPKRDALKQKILDKLFQQHERPFKLLRDLGRREYFLMLSYRPLFTPFIAGELVELRKEKDHREYVYSWGSFDLLTNRPHVYIMLFNVQGTIDLKENEEALAKFEETIKRNTHNTSPLKVIATEIDASFPELRPHLIKRIDIGPLYSHFAQDEHLYTRLLKEHFTKEDFAFSFTTEIIESAGTKRVKGNFLSKGQLRQVFKIDKSRKETAARLVSEVHQYLLASHGLVQYLSSHHPDQIKTLAKPPITFHSNSSGIYGKK